MAVTLYWIVQASATAAPSNAQIVAGQDGTGSAALAAGSEPYTSAGDYSEASAFTGATAGTAYKQYWVAYDGSTYSSQAVSDVIVTDIDLTQSSTFTNSQTWYTHTLSVGAITLTQSSTYTNSQTWFTHTLTTGAITLTQSSTYTNSPTWFTHTLDLGGISFTITPTGSIVFSGSAANIREETYEPSGSVVFSGTSPQIREKTYVPTGNIAFSGTAAITLDNGSTTWTISPSGGITFSGAPLQIKEKTYLPTGSLQFSGNATFIKENVQQPTGSVVFSGTAPLVLVPAGSSTVTTYRPLTGVGH